ncbi:MAG TPA: endonuclease/exonuclease/phosphatase family protein [Solirubrobacterales bacterium]|nr:endonuclease/exonuclease/phosphatase family protein [Solirubrobacterales bacterium]
MAAARRYWWIWIAVVPLAFWALVRLLGLDQGFPLVAMMAFTPYVATAGLLVAGVTVALRNWAAAAVAWIATLALAAVVLPRAVGDGTVAADGHRTIGILAANALRGHADPEALVGLVERLHPDVLMVEELSPELVRGLRRAGLGRLLPEAEIALHEQFGSAIYSDLPLTELDEGRVYTFPMPRARLALPGGGALRLIAIHPITPTRNGIDVWEETLAGLPGTGAGTPWVLAGDFNATLDNSALRELIGRGYRDAGDVAGLGLEPTWPNKGDVPPLVTIDHVLADRRFGVVDYAVEDVPGSDHRAVFARLRLP